MNDGTPGKSLDMTICIFTCSRALVMSWNTSLFPAPLRSRGDPQCAGTKSPAWPPCQPQRGLVLPRVEGRSWNHWNLQLTAFAINTPATAGVSCQGFCRVCHGPSKPHTAAMLLSLPDGLQRVFLAGWQKPASWRDVAGGRICPGHQGSVPCARFAVTVAQAAWVRPLAWPAGPCTDRARARSCLI